jgi:putative ABC transport system permease protein
VQSAATTATIPGNSYAYPIELKSFDRPGDPNQRIVADSRVVSTGYLSTLHVPLLQGEDCPTGLPYNTYLVNRSFAQKYFPAGTAIGHHLQSVIPGATPNPIVGIIGDVREEGLETPPQPAVYWCFSSPDADPFFLIRTHGDPAAMADTLRRKIHELEPARSVFGVMPLADRMESRQAENRLRTAVVTLFAFTAIALVSIGLIWSDRVNLRNL